MEYQEDTVEEGRKSRGRPRHWNDKTAQNTIKSLDRAMQVFDYLSREQGKTLSELSAEMRQAPATIYRVLVTLEGHGLVEFDANGQVWHIGPQAFVIGARYLRRTSLVDRARPILRDLMQASGETANLGVETEGLVLFLSQVETHASIRAFFPPGTRSPMHCSGIGKALLAEIDAGRRDRVLAAGGMAAFTAHTITDPDSLLADLNVAKMRGYAIDNEEKTEGMRCIAAAVFDLNREPVAGISVSGPTARVSRDSIDALSRAVIKAARHLTLAIGGERPPPA